MVVLKQYKEPLAPWLEITLKECIQYTEGSEYWKPGTVEEMLKNGQTVFTPSALYKMKK